MKRIAKRAGIAACIVMLGSQQAAAWLFGGGKNNDATKADARESELKSGSRRYHASISEAKEAEFLALASGREKYNKILLYLNNIIREESAILNKLDQSIFQLTGLQMESDKLYSYEFSRGLVYEHENMSMTEKFVFDKFSNDLEEKEKQALLLRKNIREGLVYLNGMRDRYNRLRKRYEGALESKYDIDLNKDYTYDQTIRVIWEGKEQGGVRSEVTR
jgi:hypothetical protein